MAIIQSESNKLKTYQALLIYLLATLMLNISDIMVKILPSYNISVIEGICLRSITTVMVLLPMIISKRKKIWANKTLFFTDMIRMLSLFLSILLMYNAMQKVPLGRVYAIGQMGPALTILIAYFYHKESISRKGILLLIANLICALIIIIPTIDTGQIIPIEADLLALLAVIMWALFNNIQRTMSQSTDIINQIFSMNLFYLVFTLPFCKSTILNTLQTLNVSEISFIFLNWAIWLTLATFLYTVSFKYAKITTLMPYEHFNLIFAVLIGYSVFDEVIMTSTWIGGMSIILVNLWYYKNNQTIDKA